MSLDPFLSRISTPTGAETRAALRRTPEEQVERYVNSVLEDITLLLNTLKPGLDPETYPEAARSVLNLGCEDLTGRFSENLRDDAVPGFIRAALVTFEPRVVPETIRVTSLPRKASTPAPGPSLEFALSCDLILPNTHDPARRMVLIAAIAENKVLCRRPDPLEANLLHPPPASP